MDCSFLQSSLGLRQVSPDLQDLLVHQVEIRHHPDLQAGEEDRRWETLGNLTVTLAGRLLVRLRDLRHRVHQSDPYQDHRRGHPREFQHHHSYPLLAELSIPRQEGHLPLPLVGPRHPIQGSMLPVPFLRHEHRGQN